MAKLYFRYGAVSSAKTMNLLAVAHNYRVQNKNVLLLKPRLDVRFGENVIKSRAGLVCEADILVDDSTEISRELLKDKHCILVDEAQFLSSKFIEKLRLIATTHNIPVICYGLRTDFKTHLFEGSLRLMELADSIEEVKTTCAYCNRKAIFNLKIKDGTPTREGPVVDLGAEEKYLPACAACYHDKLS
ncbi:MAG: thymidine kinase [Oligoflexales bacterium]|nr:thymidine kinase [Oligoflexales bacterium]